MNSVHEILSDMWKSGMHLMPSDLKFGSPIIPLEPIMAGGCKVFLDALLFGADVEECKVKLLRVPQVFIDMMGQGGPVASYNDLVIVLDSKLENKIIIEFEPTE